MTQGRPAQRPIGYWLKHTHDTLEAHMNALIEEQGLTRPHWQTLNLLHEVNAPVTKTRLFETMRTFVNAEGLNAILGEFAVRGWVSRDDDGSEAQVALTDAGKAAHGRLFEQINAMRRQSMHGISEADYGTALRVLEQMVNNLA